MENSAHNHDCDHSPTKISKGESSTWKVIALSLVVMVLEIVCGKLFGSMALLADGWHMGTHVFALGISAIAFYLARKYSRDERFTNGVDKIGVLGGFVSAMVLIAVAMMMIYESIERLVNPQEIQFNDSIIVAVIGLVVNALSAVWLHNSSSGCDHHGHSHDDGHSHNLKAAYLHVIADALTSVLAIVALLSGKYFGWYQLDSIVGIVGALVITKWGWGLLKNTGSILLDIDPAIASEGK